MELRARLCPFGDATHRVLRRSCRPSPCSGRAAAARSISRTLDCRGSSKRETGPRASGCRANRSLGRGAPLCHPLRAGVSRHCAGDRPRLSGQRRVRQRTRSMDAGGERPIVLLAGLFLSRVRLKPNMVGSVGDGTQEYVIGSGIADVITRAGWTGVTLLPITNPKTGALTRNTSRSSARRCCRRDCRLQRRTNSFGYPDDDASFGISAASFTSGRRCSVAPTSTGRRNPGAERTDGLVGRIWARRATLKKAHLRGCTFDRS